MAEAPKLRLFVALELPESWREALGSLHVELDKVASGQLRWVRPELMHLTLVFLGYLQANRLPILREALEAAGSESSPFALRLGTVGWFGQPHRLQVLWVGLEEVPLALQRLHASLSSRLSGVRVSFDSRPLVPHITLVRGRRPIDRAASLQIHSALLRVKIPSVPETRVSEFVLMQSHLSRLGPDYEVIGRFPLGGSGE